MTEYPPFAPQPLYSLYLRPEDERRFQAALAILAAWSTKLEPGSTARMAENCAQAVAWADALLDALAKENRNG